MRDERDARVPAAAVGDRSNGLEREPQEPEHGHRQVEPTPAWAQILEVHEAERHRAAPESNETGAEERGNPGRRTDEQPRPAAVRVEDEPEGPGAEEEREDDRWTPDLFQAGPGDRENNDVRQRVRGGRVDEKRRDRASRQRTALI